MSTEPFIGEIKLFGFNFAPRGYATCAGQLLSISQNTALFSLLGTQFGGDGRTTFALPNLNGRVAIGQGQSPGTSNYTMGETAGTENVTLTTAQLPMHAHTVANVKVQQKANGSTSDSNSPDGTFPGTNATTAVYAETAGNNEFMAPATVSGSTDITGSSQPLTILQPFLVINYSIALEGIFPSRQ